MSRSRRTLLAALAGLAVVLASAAPAGAHADLVSSEPAYSETSDASPERVSMRFDYPVDLDGASVTLASAGRGVKIAEPDFAGPDHREVSVALPPLPAGQYAFSYFFFADDGHVTGGEVPFAVLTVSAAAAPDEAPLAATTRFTDVSRAEDLAGLGGFVSVTVLLGGLAFVSLLWPAGARLPRTRLLLWGALVLGVVATTAALGLKGAAIAGRSPLAAFTPSAITALGDTRVAHVLQARLGFLLLAVPVVAVLTTAPARARGSHRWWIGAAVVALGVLGSHSALGHASTRGMAARIADTVHFGAVSVWLGGLVMLAAVVLPRRRRHELAALLPRWSRVAFVAVATTAGAGTVLLLLISPRWTELPASDYGRFLFIKLTLVALMVAAAGRARRWVLEHVAGLNAVPSPMPTLDLTVLEAPSRIPVGVGGRAPVTVQSAPARADVHRSPPPPVEPQVDHAALRPFVSAVAAELTIAASILAATAVLVGQPPPT